jgi:transposase
MRTRTARINSLRGFCREFGIHITQGPRIGLEQIARALADPVSELPVLLRPTLRSLIDEIRLIEVRISELEKHLGELARQSSSCETLLSIPGVGLLTATAMIAATSGEVTHFKDARHFASWFGLTPKEHSSGQKRKLGRISKQGDCYLRMLLTHGARSVIHAATMKRKAGHPLDPLRTWALAVEAPAAIATRRSAPSPTRWPASAMQRCEIMSPTVRLSSSARSNTLRLSAPTERHRRFNLQRFASENDRPSWHQGSLPHRAMPVTSLAA